MILDIVYPAPACGEPETRPPVVYKVHFLYYNCMVAVVSFVLTVVVSLITEPPPPEMVSALNPSSQLGRFLFKHIFRRGGCCNPPSDYQY